MNTEVLDTAIDKFLRLGLFKCKIIKPQKNGKQNDIAAIQLTNPKKPGEKWGFQVKVTNKIVPAQIDQVADQMKTHQPCIYVANYITPQAKQILRQRNMAYMDTTGNVFITGKNLLIFIETNKTNRAQLPTGNRAFTKAGLKVVYQLLVHPDHLNQTYRFIGAQARVAIDTVGRVYRDLLRDRYLIKTNENEYRFQDRPRLFQEWVTNFHQNLRPKLKQKRYRPLNKGDDLKKLNLPGKTCWGGAVAAEILTDHLIGDTGIIYTEQNFKNIVKQLKVIPDQNGMITIVEMFWQSNEKDQIAHPMLIYADLIREMNPRYMDAANKIYKDHVQDLL